MMYLRLKLYAKLPDQIILLNKRVGKKEEFSKVLRRRGKRLYL
jgi:hypothetical protein